MSFSLLVLSMRGVSDEADLDAIYSHLAAGRDWSEVLSEDPEVATLVDELLSQWPRLEDLDESEVDQSPWSASPDSSPAHITLAVVADQAAVVMSTVLDLATRLGLAVYDPQAEELHVRGSTHPTAARSPEVITCSACSKVIEPGEDRLEDPTTGDVWHVECGLDALERDD